MPNSCSITPAVLKIVPLLLLLAILAMPAAAQNGVLLTHPDGPDIANHLDAGFAVLQTCEAWNSRFINNFSPGGHGGVITCTTFQLLGADTTPAPYNQPPYPAAGDTASALCTVTGVAP